MKQQKSNNSFVYVVLGLIVVSIVVLAYVRTRPKPTPPGADALAQCLADKGVKFYGASWCSHCKEQKEMFGGAESKLTYIECAVGQGQSQICTKAGIVSYPTWVNAQGEKQLGALSFKQLADFSGCPFNP